MSRKDDATGDLFKPGKSGLELGYEAAQRAADHAGDSWKERAYAALLAYARTHDTFTVEDVRLASPSVGEPPDLRAWGQVALRAKRAGAIRSMGWTRPNDPAVHGGVVNRWRKA